MGAPLSSFWERVEDAAAFGGVGVRVARFTQTTFSTDLLNQLLGQGFDNISWAVL